MRTRIIKKTFVEVSNDFRGYSETYMILQYESPPIILSGPMFKRVFQLTEKEALHSISLPHLKNKFPKIVGRAKHISTFTQMQSHATIWKSGIGDDRSGGMVLHVKGNVTGQFNQDLYTEMLKGGRRVIMLNDDTIDDQEFEDELKKLQSDLRELVHTIFIKDLKIIPEKTYGSSDDDYPSEFKQELDGRQKNTLIKKYMQGMEKLIASKKYKEEVSDMMFDMIAIGDYEYNEVIMEKVKLLAIYVVDRNIDHKEIGNLKKQFKVPVYPNTSRSQIEKVLQSINS